VIKNLENPQNSEHISIMFENQLMQPSDI